MVFVVVSRQFQFLLVVQRGIKVDMRIMVTTSLFAIIGFLPLFPSSAFCRNSSDTYCRYAMNEVSTILHIVDLKSCHFQNIVTELSP